MLKPFQSMTTQQTMTQPQTDSTLTLDFRPKQLVQSNSKTFESTKKFFAKNPQFTIMPFIKPKINSVG